MEFPGQGQDRSKDIPGKEGYSVRDAEKLMDVIRNPGKYGVDPNDNGGDKDSCFDKLFQFLFLVITVGSLISNM